VAQEGVGHRTVADGAPVRMRSSPQQQQQTAAAAVSGTVVASPVS